MDGPALQDGETALWSGRPEGGIAFHSIDFFLIPFSIVWGSGALMAVFQIGKGGFPTMVGLLFGGAAIYITVGRFIVDALRRDRTRYYLTDRRAFIVTNFPFKRTRTKSVTPGMAVEYEEGRFLSVWFGERPSFFQAGGTQGMGTAPPGFVFERIGNGEELRRYLDALTGQQR